MFWLGLGGIVLGLILSYLRHPFLRRETNNVGHWEPEWWFDTISFILILIAAFIAGYALVQSQAGRELAEELRNELQRQVESLRPYRQPLTSGHATVQIRVKSDREVRGHVSGQGAFVEFMKGGNRLLWGAL